MASMTIRNIDERLKARLRLRAAMHNRSMEEEARDILRAALATGSAGKRSLVEAIRSRVEPLGGIDLEQPRRDVIRKPPELDK